jgi:hypothetical protein
LAFIHLTAISLPKRDPEFSLEEAIDFMLRVFVEGRVQGKGTPLTVQEREDYFQRIDSESFTCTFTGRRLQFFISFMGDIWLHPIELFGKRKVLNGNLCLIVIQIRLLLGVLGGRTSSTTLSLFEMLCTIG